MFFSCGPRNYTAAVPYDKWNFMLGLIKSELSPHVHTHTVHGLSFKECKLGPVSSRPIIFIVFSTVAIRKTVP